MEASDSTDFPNNVCKQKKLQKTKNKLGKENQPDIATYTGRTKSSCMYITYHSFYALQLL